jgi:hypothetical protein
MAGRDLLIRCGVVFAMALAGSVRPDPSRADSCGQALAKPDVDVRMEMMPAELDVSQSLKTIGSSPEFALLPMSDQAGHTIGITKLGVPHEWRFSLEGRERSEGGYCWSVKSLELKVSAVTTVFIAREIPRDSCVWREVLSHEGLHVELDRRLFPQFADHVRPQLFEAATHTVAAATGDDAKAIFEARIADAVGTAVDGFLDKRNALQLNIDSAEEYARFNRVCGDAELRAILARGGLN